MDPIVSEFIDNLSCHEERRHFSAAESDCYDRLSLAQKFSVSKLSHFGYQLIFVRTETYKKIAALKNDSSFITVDYLGEINTSPRLIFRKND